MAFEHWPISTVYYVPVYGTLNTIIVIIQATNISYYSDRLKKPIAFEAKYQSDE